MYHDNVLPLERPLMEGKQQICVKDKNVGLCGSMFKNDPSNYKTFEADFIQSNNKSQWSNTQYLWKGNATIKRRCYFLSRHPTYRLFSHISISKELRTSS